MKSKELRELSKDALVAKVTELSEQLFRMRFQHSIRPLENTSKIRDLKKDISRAKTILTEKLAV